MLGAMVLSAGLGMLIERFAYRPGRSHSRFALAFWLGILGAAPDSLVRSIASFVAVGALAGIADRIRTGEDWGCVRPKRTRGWRC